MKLVAKYEFPLSQKVLLNDAIKLLRNNQVPHNMAQILMEKTFYFTSTLKIQEYNSGQAL